VRSVDQNCHLGERVRHAYGHVQVSRPDLGRHLCVLSELSGDLCLCAILHWLTSCQFAPTHLFSAFCSACALFLCCISSLLNLPRNHILGVPSLELLISCFHARTPLSYLTLCVHLCVHASPYSKHRVVHARGITRAR